MVWSSEREYLKWCKCWREYLKVEVGFRSEPFLEVFQWVFCLLVWKLLNDFTSLSLLLYWSANLHLVPEPVVWPEGGGCWVWWNRCMCISRPFVVSPTPPHTHTRPFIFSKAATLKKKKKKEKGKCLVFNVNFWTSNQHNCHYRCFIDCFLHLNPS